MIIHSIVNLGGTLWRPEDKIVSLQGLGRKAAPILIKPETSPKALSLSFPQDEKLLKCSNITELRQIHTDRHAKKVNCTPAPFKTKAILESKTKDPCQLSLAAIPISKQRVDTSKQAIAEGDEDEDKEENKVKDTFLVSATRLHHWLWAVGNRKSPDAVFIPDSDNEELKEPFQWEHMPNVFCLLLKQVT